MQRVIFILTIVMLSARSACAAEQSVALVEKHLQAGTLSAGETALEGLLKQNPRDDEARFGLGTVQFIRAVEGLSQSLYRHGFLHSAGRFAPVAFPGSNIPIPNNPRPQSLNYDQARKIVQDFVSGLAKADATLAKIDSDKVKLPLHFGMIRLDFDGDGKAGEDETLWRIYANLNRQASIQVADAKQFVISFDAADVYWLRGYCHLLMTFGEVNLAHDWRELFERCGHLLFARTETPYAFVKEVRPEDSNAFSFPSIADLIALIHTINFQVAEPKRMGAALEHLETMIALSRKSWDLILKESDDDNEWIPSPKQTGIIPNVKVTPQMVEGWKEFLSETESILKGQKLLPFWRGTEARGINLRRVFTEPKPLDLVLWVQGTGAAPFLEKGPITDQAVWERLMRIFEGEFIGFAMWFN